MNKIVSILFLAIFIILTSLTIVLSVFGIETNRFNKIISKKINQTNSKINLELTSIKFKLDIKEISLFLETNNSKINYRDTRIPAKNIKVYINFISLIKSEPEINKINLTLNQIDIEQLKTLSFTFKPSNFTSFLNNKISQGKLSTELEVYLDNNNIIENFIARGSVSNLKTEIINDINLEKTSFNFFADNSDVLLTNILSETGPLKISNGDLKFTINPEISIETNFRTSIKYKNNLLNYKNLIKNYEYAKDLVYLEADLNNRFLIHFDKTYKVKKFNFNNKGKITKATLNFKKSLENYFFEEKINQLSLINSEIDTNFNSKKNTTNISGKYAINNENPLTFSLENIAHKNLLDFKLKADYKKPIELELINYNKPKEIISNIFINLEKKKDSLKIKEISLTEKNNSIVAENITFSNNKLLSFDKIKVKTNKNGRKNNDFSIIYKNKIEVKGLQFDASNLPKILNRKNSKNSFSHISKDIDISFANIKAPLSENLSNFKLIGRIEKGKFIKISSKGDFGENNFLDISMKKDKKNLKYLEIYSDLTGPLLTEYSFFKGLTGGKLLYSSVIDGDNASSKLKIENFKIINAPGVIKLLSLADLGGLADLAEGEGLSFDFLEINMEKNKDLLKLKEIVAIGPSISVLMDGYQNSTVTSLRGTLVPAKTFNKMISKIPVLGDIIIPKEIGEGLFGVSFKLKGPPGNIKSTINPIRTLTPRFIQKIIDKSESSK